MIKNKLKINDSKTEIIVFRSPQAKQDLSSLSVYVGDSIIQQSSKVVYIYIYIYIYITCKYRADQIKLNHICLILFMDVPQNI